jgi:hypothetical protein
MIRCSVCKPPPPPLPLEQAVAILQNKKKTNKRVARSIKTAEGEIRELVTQKYTGVVKPKLEEGIGGGGVAAAANPEPTPKQKERRGEKRKKAVHPPPPPLPLEQSVAILQTKKNTNKNLTSVWRAASKRFKVK